MRKGPDYGWKVMKKCKRIFLLFCLSAAMCSTAPQKIPVIHIEAILQSWEKHNEKYRIKGPHVTSLYDKIPVLHASGGIISDESEKEERMTFGELIPIKIENNAIDYSKIETYRSLFTKKLLNSVNVEDPIRKMSVDSDPKDMGTHLPFPKHFRVGNSNSLNAKVSHSWRKMAFLSNTKIQKASKLGDTLSNLKTDSSDLGLLSSNPRTGDNGSTNSASNTKIHTNNSSPTHPNPNNTNSGSGTSNINTSNNHNSTSPNNSDSANSTSSPNSKKQVMGIVPIIQKPKTITLEQCIKHALGIPNIAGLIIVNDKDRCSPNTIASIDAMSIPFPTYIIKPSIGKLLLDLSTWYIGQCSYLSNMTSIIWLRASLYNTKKFVTNGFIELSLLFMIILMTLAFVLSLIFHCYFYRQGYSARHPHNLSTSRHQNEEPRLSPNALAALPINTYMSFVRASNGIGHPPIPPTGGSGSTLKPSQGPHGKSNPNANRNGKGKGGNNGNSQLPGAMTTYSTLPGPAGKNGISKCDCRFPTENPCSNARCASRTMQSGLNVTQKLMKKLKPNPSDLPAGKVDLFDDPSTSGNTQGAQPGTSADSTDSNGDLSAISGSAIPSSPDPGSAIVHVSGSINMSTPSLDHPSKVTSMAQTSTPKWSVNDTCPICLDEFYYSDMLRELPCKHIYHLPCIDLWLVQKSAKCPLCKFSLCPDPAFYKSSPEVIDAST